MLNKVFLIVIIVVAGLFAIPWIWNFIHPLLGLAATLGLTYGVIRLIQHWLKDM